MKTTFYIITMLCCWTLTKITAQSEGFLQTYDSELNHDVIESPNGGYLMVGKTSLTGFPQILLRQTNAQGMALWEKEIPAPSTETAWDIILAGDNTGYMLVGNTSVGSDVSNVLALKIDWNGDVIWRKSYGTSEPEYGSTVIAHDDNTYSILGTKIAYGETDTIEQVQLLRIDEEGDSLWNQTYEYRAEHTRFSLVAHEQAIQAEPNNGVYFLGRIAGDLHLVKVDALGVPIEDVTLEVPTTWSHGFNFKTLISGDFVLIGNDWELETGDITLRTVVIKINAEGDILWQNTYRPVIVFNTFPLVVYRKYVAAPHIDEAENGDLIFTANIIAEDIGDEILVDSKGYLIRTNADGEELWNRSFPLPAAYYQIRSLEKSTDNHLVIAGDLIDEIGETSNRVFLIKVNENGEIYENYIQGTVAIDENEDCEFDTAEQTLKDWQIQLSNALDTFRTTTNEAGYYTFNVEANNYTLTLFPPNPLWTTCENDIPVQLDVSDTLVIDFPMQSLNNCPYMQVDIAAPFLRRCFESTYTVSYKNEGTATAENAYIEVTLDEHLIYQDATIPLASQNENVYTFDIGDIAIGESDFFKINVEVDCDAELGLTHCSEAHIFPDELCAPLLYIWEGPVLLAEGDCDGDSIVFTIKNVGDSDMEEALEYFVVEDELILMQAPFRLDAGADTSFVVFPQGATYRLEVAQATGHPITNSHSVTIEACGTDAMGNISTGFVNLFPQNDHEHFLDIDCQENIGSFDPNDKQGFPKGYGMDHFIEANTDLEYLIRFQNTGTDTAFTVVIKDELSPYLDITSIRPGASSHVYDFKISNERLLEFSFENIMLPDSNVNEAASHGFVTFKIKQMPNNPNGTLILNQAGIYFDFNPPVITNTVKHTVGENFIEIAPPTSLSPKFAPVTIKAYPNPFSERVVFEIENMEISQFTFSLYDFQGKLVRQADFFDIKYEFQRQNLVGGMYFFEIENKGKLIGNGKLVLVH